MNDNPLLGLSHRLPPSNIQAEQALLGALMANNLASRHVDGWLEPAHFADPVHGARSTARSWRPAAWAGSWT